jgi:hypothetical protein
LLGKFEEPNAFQGLHRLQMPLIPCQASSSFLAVYQMSRLPHIGEDTLM